jgi:hypothetical protein
MANFIMFSVSIAAHLSGTTSEPHAGEKRVASTPASPNVDDNADNETDQEDPSVEEEEEDEWSDASGGTTTPDPTTPPPPPYCTRQEQAVHPPNRYSPG